MLLSGHVFYTIVCCCPFCFVGGLEEVSPPAWVVSIPPFPPPLPPPHEGASPHMGEFSHNKEKPSKRNKAESVTKHKVFESFAPHWSIFVTEKAEKPSSASKMMRFTWCLGNVGVEPNRGF